MTLASSASSSSLSLSSLALSSGKSFLFSSAFLVPLSRMLSGNYWDTEMSVVRRRPSSVVRRASCVVNNFLKEHLLLNCLANFNQISQECSLGDPFSK